MKDKIIQVSGFGVRNTQYTQCEYMIAGLTESGKVIITTGDGIWADISPKEQESRIKVIISNGAQSYTEDVTEDQKEYFQEISTNGANPELTTFGRWTRELEPFDIAKVAKYNTRDSDCHFIFGWLESFSQSDNVPDWMRSAGEILISVKHEVE